MRWGTVWQILIFISQFSLKLYIQFWKYFHSMTLARLGKGYCKKNWVLKFFGQNFWLCCFSAFKELILSWAIIARFLFFPLKFSRKPPVRDVLLLLLNEAGSGLKICSDSTRLLFEISEHPLVFNWFCLV